MARVKYRAQAAVVRKRKLQQEKLDKKKRKDNPEEATDVAQEGVEGDDTVYEVEKILRKRIHEDGFTEYRIKWKGYDRNWNSWEPQHMLNCELLIDEFENKEAKKTRRKKTSSSEDSNELSSLSIRENSAIVDVTENDCGQIPASTSKEAADKPSDIQEAKDVIEDQNPANPSPITKTKVNGNYIVNKMMNEKCGAEDENPKSKKVKSKVKISYLAQGVSTGTTYVYFEQEGVEGSRMLPYQAVKELYPLALVDYFEPFLVFTAGSERKTKLY